MTADVPIAGRADRRERSQVADVVASDVQRSCGEGAAATAWPCPTSAKQSLRDSKGAFSRSVTRHMSSIW